MEIDEFIEENRIGIFVEADLERKVFYIRKMDRELESYDLFQQLILYNSTENLDGYLSGKLLPQTWGQGNTVCILCKPNEGQIFALFLDTDLGGSEFPQYVKQLDVQLKEALQERQRKGETVHGNQ